MVEVRPLQFVFHKCIKLQCLAPPNLAYLFNQQWQMYENVYPQVTSQVTSPEASFTKNKSLAVINFLSGMICFT